MSKKQIDSKQESRRKVLRNTLIGGAVISTSVVPEKWSKPVLDSVLLPAHAATTDNTGNLPGGNPTTTVAPTTTPSPTTTPNKKFITGIQFKNLDYDVT